MICTKCNINKDLSEYYVLKPSGIHKRHCKKCCLAITKVRDNQKGPRYKKNIMLKFGYDLTIDDYEKQLEIQNYVCSICNTKNEEILSVDHNHKTGKVRGLLCRKCNHALGVLNDNPNLFLNAINYIKNDGFWFKEHIITEEKLIRINSRSGTAWRKRNRN